MNFLAHSLMGFNDPALIAGQFCGDFVRGSRLSQFPAGMERGIRLHRHLDVFTDNFPELQSIRQSAGAAGEGRTIQVPRRFIGIVVDVLFDHYLARHWQQISALSLREHADQAHAALDQHHQHLPESLQRFLQVLRRERILEANLQIEAIELTLARIAGRSPRLGALAIDTQQLLLIRDRLDEPFEVFLPALRHAAVTFLGHHPVKEPS